MNFGAVVVVLLATVMAAAVVNGACSSCQVPFNQVQTISYDNRNVPVTYYFNSDGTAVVTGGLDNCNYRATGSYVYNQTTCIVSEAPGATTCEQTGGTGTDCIDADDACSTIVTELIADNSLCRAGGISSSCSSCVVPFHLTYSLNYEGFGVNVVVYLNSDGTAVSIGGANGCNYKCMSGYSYNQNSCYASVSGSITGQLTSGNSDLCPTPQDACNELVKAGPVENSYCTPGGSSGHSLVASLVTLVGAVVASVFVM